jgi:ankyrin repeat protein
VEGADRAGFTADQQLVVAAFELDVPKVEALLKAGANPNARLGVYDERLFENKWTLGLSAIGSNKWTPLLAVAGSHRAPQPETRAENTIEGRKAAFEKLKAIDPKLIAERDGRRLAIARLLIEAKAELDADDGYGDTALAQAVYAQYEGLALLLIEAGAKIDTKTGVYIDGPADITPVHRATSIPVVLKAMLKRGAKVNVQDSDGATPLYWAALDKNVESVKLLLEAGADPTIKDNEGRLPAYWCAPGPFTPPNDAAKERQIANLLQAAAKPDK